jgi:hypothetical protein
MVPINPTTKKYSPRGMLREVYLVTEFRDGCVYKTKSIGFVVASSYAPNPCVKHPEGILSSISTKDSKRLMEIK